MMVQSERAVLMGILRLVDLLYHPSGRKQSRTGPMVTSFFAKSFPDEFWKKRVIAFFSKKFHMNYADYSN